MPNAEPVPFITRVPRVANTVLAGPITGADATAAFRALVAADIPSLASVYQPLDSDLTAIAALTTTAYGRALLELANAAAARTALALGTLATQDGTFSGASSGTNTGDQDLSGLCVKSANLSDLTNAATARANLGLGNVATISHPSTGGNTYLNDDGNFTTPSLPALDGILGADKGGTGANTLTTNNVILGNGTSAVQFVAPGSSGNVLTSNGTTWESTAPAASGITALTGHVTAIGSGSVAASLGSFTISQLNTAVSDADVAILGANTFTALQTITQASANAGIIASSGYSLTGSSTTKAVDITGTWNTSGIATGLNFAITNTASSASSTIAYFGTTVVGMRIGPLAQVSVSTSGQWMVGANTGWDTYKALFNQSGFQFKSDAVLAWAASSSQAEGSKDTSLSRNAAGVLQIGTGAANALGSLACVNATLTGNLTVGNGTAITKILSAAATLDFGSTAAGADTDLTITVTGAAVGNPVILGIDNASAVAGMTFTAWVSATNTVTIRYHNSELLTTRDPASGTFRATVLQF